MSTTPRVHVELHDEGCVATFTDERIVDEPIIEAIGEQLLGLVERQDQTRLVLNFANVRFLGSAMLAKLFMLKKRIEKAKGRLILCNIDTNVRPVFKFAPRGAFEIKDDEDDALEVL